MRIVSFWIEDKILQGMALYTAVCAIQQIDAVKRLGKIASVWKRYLSSRVGETQCHAVGIRNKYHDACFLVGLLVQPGHHFILREGLE